VSILASTLIKLFEKHRLIFWYDEKKNLRHEFDELELEGVKKFVIENDEFWLKHYVLREKTTQKFLIYHAGAMPSDDKNWLLDLVLAHKEFRADQISLWLSEMGLKPSDWNFVNAHTTFFESEENRQKFSQLSGSNRNIEENEKILLSVALDSSSLLIFEDILKVLLDEYSKEDSVFISRINLHGLEDYLWLKLEQEFDYTSAHLSIKDFALSLFKTCYAQELKEGMEEDDEKRKEKGYLNTKALLFMHHWKDSINFRESFELISDQCAELLNIKEDLQTRSISELINIDLFESVERNIIKELVNEINNRSITGGDANTIIWQRRKSIWFNRYKDMYEALQYAAQFFSAIPVANLEIEDVKSGFDQYQSKWYKLDRLYRNCLYHAKKSNSTPGLETILVQIEKQYTNAYLLSVNDRWQQHINQLHKWKIDGVRPQQNFYFDLVYPYFQKSSRLAVIISDALRYEIATELNEQLQKLSNVETNLTAMSGVIPSYTQLGMAALLPNEKIELFADGSVLVDNQPSSGIENRAKILSKAHQEKATAVKFTDIYHRNRQELRDLLVQYPILYVYHNHIDQVGDKRETEGNVFNAVEDSMLELITLIKRLLQSGTNHVLVTSDHGFLYQDRELDESEFIGEDVRDEFVTYRNRRFILGKDLNETSSVKKYLPDQIGYIGDVEILIPKSINRMRLSGAGSRFVHGGSTLQEIIIPVIDVHKVDTLELKKVNVEIIRGNVNTITSGQFSVKFYQKEPVGSSILPRELRAGLYAQDGSLLSNQPTFDFDLVSENAEEREVKVRFILNQQADQYNNQDVILKLEEQAPDTNHFVKYKEINYKLKKSIISDFDF
jgi:uncharacterized protein (TIGR02687 family)